jgi:hypothetical protein
MESLAQRLKSLKEKVRFAILAFKSFDKAKGILMSIEYNLDVRPSVANKVLEGVKLQLKGKDGYDKSESLAI